jgi:hypothetical protein
MEIATARKQGKGISRPRVELKEEAFEKALWCTPRPFAQWAPSSPANDRVRHQGFDNGNQLQCSHYVFLVRGLPALAFIRDCEANVWRQL